MRRSEPACRHAQLVARAPKCSLNSKGVKTLKTLPVTYKFLLGSGFMISTCLPDLWPKMLIEKAAEFASPSRDIRFVARGKEKERERE